MRIVPAALSILLLFVSSGVLEAQQVHGFPTLRQGTAVPLQLDETLNSAHARVGQRVAFEVTADVMVEDQVVIPAGSAALGTVGQVSRHGWAGHSWHEGAGRLEVNVDAVRLPGGQIVPLNVIQDGGAFLNGSGIATSVAPPAVSVHVVSTRRQDILIPEGSVLRAYVRRDTVIVQQTASASN